MLRDILISNKSSGVERKLTRQYGVRGTSLLKSKGFWKAEANEEKKKLDPPRPGLSWCGVPYLKAVVRPRAEFHLAALIVKGEPGNVYLTSAFEYAGRYV